MREIVRAAERFCTRAPDKQTWHSFSYGAHYDPERIGFGVVSALNVEHLEPGAGYEAHRHSDVEIVTWVLAGALEHADSAGHHGIIRPGTAQRLSAGSGVEHTERNASTTEPLVFVQLMLRSDHVDEPQYAAVEVERRPGVLAATVPVATSAQVLVATLDADHPAPLCPDATQLLLHVTRGSVLLDGTPVHTGDEVHTDEPWHELTATKPADVLVVAMSR